MLFLAKIEYNAPFPKNYKLFLLGSFLEPHLFIVIFI